MVMKGQFSKATDVRWKKAKKRKGNVVASKNTSLPLPHENSSERKAEPPPSYSPRFSWVPWRLCSISPPPYFPPGLPLSSPQQALTKPPPHPPIPLSLALSPKKVCGEKGVCPNLAAEAYLSTGGHTNTSSHNKSSSLLDGGALCE